MAKVALLVSVGSFIHPDLQPLPKAAADVDAMQQTLLDPDLGAFHPANLTVLKDPPKRDLDAALYHLFLSNRQRDDLLLFYFSGHGLVDESYHFYFSSRETEKRAGKLLPYTAVAASTIHQWMSKSRCRRQALILDCCYSGAFVKGMAIKGSATANLDQQLGGEGRAILTAASATEYAWAGEEYDLSLYTHHLLQGIRTGAANTDGDEYLSMEELHTYVSSKIRDSGYDMTPEFYPVRDGGKIRLVKAKPADPNLDYQNAVQHCYLKRRQFTIADRTHLDLLRQQLGLSELEAQAIERSVRTLDEQKQQHCQLYQQTLAATLAAEGTLDRERIQQDDFKQLQHTLNLADEDTERLLQAILSKHEPPQPQPQPNWQVETSLKPETRDSNPKVAPSPPSSVVSHKVETPPRILPNSHLSIFEFEMVTISNVEKTGFLGLGRPRVNLSRQRQQAKYFAEDLDNGVTLEMVSIPGGRFLMGSPDGEGSSHEKPQHAVTLQPFFIGKYPVTQAQWQAVVALPQVERPLNPDPSRFKGADRPVEQISWLDAGEFCARLSQKTRRKYRLPSEAEWEYACRAGTTTSFHFGETITTNLANYNGTDKKYSAYGRGPKGEYRQRTTPTEYFKVANAFGLYDMHGNVSEWCADSWHDTYKGAPDDGTIWLSSNESSTCVLRGGSWRSFPRDCCSVVRYGSNRSDTYVNIGFRVVCVAL